MFDRKEYNKKNREKINKRQREYTKNNPEKIKLQRKKYRERHRGKLIVESSEYYKKNKEKMLKNNKKYRQEHKEHLNEKKKEWVKQNPELRTKYSREYQEKNPEATLQRQMKYLTKVGKIHDLDYNDTKLALFTWARAVKKRDKNSCVKCGSKDHLEAHHIKHKKDYPELAFDVDNGETLCDQCHYKSHGKLGGF